MTRGAIHATDYSNISVSGLWDPYTFRWLDWLINLLRIPKSLLPEIRDSCTDFGSIHATIFGAEIPIRCIVRFLKLFLAVEIAGLLSYLVLCIRFEIDRRSHKQFITFLRSFQRKLMAAKEKTCWLAY